MVVVLVSTIVVVGCGPSGLEGALLLSVRHVP